MSTNHLQLFNTLAEIASGIFGGDKKDKPQPIKINDLSADAAVHAMNSVFEMAGAR